MIIRFGQDFRKIAARLFRIPVILVAMCAFGGTTAQAIPINGVDISGGGIILTNTDTVIGWIFRAEQNVNVTALGMWDENGDGFTADVQVGLWNASGTLLATSLVSDSDSLTNGFRFASIGAVSLTAGADYVVAGLLAAPDNYRYDTAVTNSAGASWLGARYEDSGSLTFPTQAFVNNAGWFGANFQYEQPVPVPATLALCGLGLIGLGWSRRKKA